MKNQLVVQSNHIIGRRNPMTLMEQRIVYAAVSAIDSRVGNNTRDYELPLAEFQNAFGEQCLAQVDEAIQRLMHRHLTFEKPIEINGKMYNKHTVHWLESISRGNGIISIRFSEAMMPMLENLADSFTQYKLGSIANFKSNYSVKLYELLVQYRKYGERVIEIGEFRELLGVTDKYKEFKALRVRVINIAMEDINENTDINVTLKPKRTGRFITHLIFKIKKNLAVLSQQGIDHTLNRIKTTLASFDKDLYIDGVKVLKLDSDNVLWFENGDKRDVMEVIREIPNYEGRDK